MEKNKWSPILEYGSKEYIEKWSEYQHDEIREKVERMDRWELLEVYLYYRIDCIVKENDFEIEKDGNIIKNTYKFEKPTAEWFTHKDRNIVYDNGVDWYKHNRASRYDTRETGIYRYVFLNRR